MSIFYTNNIDKIQPEKLKGFFVGWPNKPDLETHFKILKNSFAVWIALDGDRCVGFINAISDKIFYSFIPLLEVLPEYQGCQWQLNPVQFWKSNRYTLLYHFLFPSTAPQPIGVAAANN